jgi:hypothetical protein
MRVRSGVGALALALMLYSNTASADYSIAEVARDLSQTLAQCRSGDAGACHKVDFYKGWLWAKCEDGVAALCGVMAANGIPTPSQILNAPQPNSSSFSCLTTTAPAGSAVTTCN